MDGNSPWFPLSAEYAITDAKKNADERIKYFPSYIETPIDIRLQ